MKNGKQPNPNVIHPINGKTKGFNVTYDDGVLLLLSYEKSFENNNLSNILLLFVIV